MRTAWLGAVLATALLTASSAHAGARRVVDDGVRVGAVGTDVWREGLQIAGALGGALVISRPARITLTLPSGVSMSRPDTIAADTKTIWKLGDPIT